MRVEITVTAIKRNKDADYAPLSAGYTMFLEGAELEFHPKGTVLAVYNPMSKTEYVTDFAFSGVKAVLDAAATTGGGFTLT